MRKRSGVRNFGSALAVPTMEHLLACSQSYFAVDLHWDPEIGKMAHCSKGPPECIRACVKPKVEATELEHHPHDEV